MIYFKKIQRQTRSTSTNTVYPNTTLFRSAGDQKLAGREPREVLAVTRQAAVDLRVVGIRHAFLESDALALEGRDGGIDVVGAERDVLDPLASVLLQILGDLRFVEIGRAHV